MPLQVHNLMVKCSICSSLNRNKIFTCYWREKATITIKGDFHYLTAETDIGRPIDIFGTSSIGMGTLSGEKHKSLSVVNSNNATIVVLTDSNTTDDDVTSRKLTGSFAIQVYIKQATAIVTDTDGDTISAYTWRNETVTITLTHSQKGILMDHSLDQIVYKGEWHDDLQHGVGVYRYSNNDLYEGTLVRGKRVGHGKLVFSNGDKYIGHFLNDFMHGTGTLVTKYSTYVGAFVENTYQGNCYTELYSI